MPVLLAVIDRMKDAKAAAVLAAMTPDKARDVTTQLALLRTKPAAAVDADGKPVPNPTPDPASGAAQESRRDRAPDHFDRTNRKGSLP